MQANEARAVFELGERPAQIRIGEDALGLLGLVGAAEQHGVGARVDQRGVPLQVGPDRGHDQGQDPLPGQQLARGERGRLDLVLLDRDADRAELLRQARPRPRRVVRDEAQGMTVGAQALDALGRAGNRLAGDVQDAIDVDENGRHRRRVYSGDATT